MAKAQKVLNTDNAKQPEAKRGQVVALTERRTRRSKPGKVLSSAPQGEDAAAQETVPEQVAIQGAVPRGEGGALAFQEEKSYFIPLNRIRTSQLNPRRRFEAEPTLELSLSIDKQGLLQNLVLRPVLDEASPVPSIDELVENPQQIFEVVAGERRKRALDLLRETGRIAEDYPVRAAIRILTDAEFLEIALTENVQREPMHPMEEAFGFASLARLGSSGRSVTASLADKMGKTQRWVQIRISLAERLIPEIQQAFLRDEINLESARAFTQGTPERQRQIWEAYGPERLDAAYIRIRMTGDLPKVGSNVFPIETYEGEIVEDEVNEERFFLDVAQFERLQADALPELESRLGATWAWVRTVTVDESLLYEKSTGRKAGALIVIDSKTKALKAVQEGVQKKQAPPRSRSQGPGAKQEAKAPVGHGGLVRAQTLKTAALQSALLECGFGMILRVACYSLLAQTTTLSLSFDSRHFSVAVSERLTNTLKNLGVKVPNGKSGPALTHFADKENAALLWEALARAEAPALEELVRCVVALSLYAHSPHDSGYQLQPGDEPETISLAAALQVETVPATAADIKEIVESYSTERLQGACALVTGSERRSLPPARTALLETLMNSLGQSTDQAPTWTPPELRFGPPQAVLEAIPPQPQAEQAGTKKKKG